MKKRKLKEYTGVAEITYTNVAFAWYVIHAEDDETAAKLMREIVSGPHIVDKADSIDEEDRWFNSSGEFRLARGYEMPSEDDDPAVVIKSEQFTNKT